MFINVLIEPCESCRHPEKPRKRLHRRRENGPARAVESGHRYFGQPCPRDEIHPYCTAADRPPAPAHHHLKHLWPVVGGAVILRRRLKPHVIAHAALFHECRNELVRRQTPKCAILRRYDHVEAPSGACYLSPFGQPPQRLVRRRRRYAECGAELRRREVVFSAGRELPHQVPSASYFERTHCASNVVLNVIFRNRNMRHRPCVCPSRRWSSSTAGRLMAARRWRRAGSARSMTGLCRRAVRNDRDLVIASTTTYSPGATCWDIRQRLRLIGFKYLVESWHQSGIRRRDGGLSIWHRSPHRTARLRLSCE